MNNKENKMEIFIDFDGTVVNSMKRISQMVNDEHHLNRKWWKIKKYNLTDIYGDIDIENVKCNFSKISFFNEKLKKKFFVEFVLNKTLKFANLFIATLGTKNNLRYKEYWCKNNLSFVYKFIGTENFSMNKKDIDMSGGILIDDNMEMIYHSSAKYKILIKGYFDRDWNDYKKYNYSPSDTFFVCKSWIGIFFVLNKIFRIERKFQNRKGYNE